jgi:hypothetical protein
MQFYPPPITSSLTSPDIILRTLFSNTRSLCSSLSVRDQVFRPYKTTDLEYSNFYVLRQQTRKQKILDLMSARLIQDNVYNHQVWWKINLIERESNGMYSNLK